MSEAAPRQRWLNSTTISLFLTGLILIGISIIWADTEQKLLHGFLELGRDMGFAIWVSITVFALFEVRSRHEFEQALQNKFDAQREEIGNIITAQDQRLDEQVASIARNVFFGVFKRNLPEALIQETSVLILQQNLIKRGMTVRYTLQDRTYERASDGQTVPFVCLTARVDYSVENIGSFSVDVPIGLKLPNPIVDEMIEAVSLDHIGWKLDRDEEWNAVSEEEKSKMNHRSCKKRVAIAIWSEAALENTIN